MEPPTCPLDQLKARYLAEHRAKNHSPKTIQRYEATFDDLHRFCAAAGKPWDSSMLTSESMLAFGAWLRETPAKVWRGTTERSIYTVHGRLKDLRSFTRWLADEEHLRQPPKIHLPKLPETIFPILSDDQLRELFCCGHLSGKGEQAIRNRALISLLLDTGMRLSEIAGLPLEAVDFEQCMAKVTGKGNKQRFVFFSSGVAAYLAAWMQIRGTEAGLLFWLTAR